MKLATWMLALAVGAGLVVAVLVADEAPKVKQPVVKEGEKPKVEAGREGEPKVLRVPEAAAKMDKVVAFTDEQKQEIVKLNKAREAKIKEINAQFQTDVAGLMTPEQKVKWEQAAKEGERKEGERKEGQPKEGERRVEGEKPK